MSLSTNFRDGRNAPSLLAMGIALAIFPNLSQAAGTSEDTIIVEGSADSASETQEQDYSVRTTSAGTKMEMAQRDIPQSVSIITEQRMRDQQLQTLGDVMDHTMGISSSQADSDRTSYYSRGFEIDNYGRWHSDFGLNLAGIWATRFPIWPSSNGLRSYAAPTAC